MLQQEMEEVRIQFLAVPRVVPRRKLAKWKGKGLSFPVSVFACLSCMSWMSSVPRAVLSFTSNRTHTRAPRPGPALFSATRAAHDGHVSLACHSAQACFFELKTLRLLAQNRSSLLAVLCCRLHCTVTSRTRSQYSFSVPQSERSSYHMYHQDCLIVLQS